MRRIVLTFLILSLISPTPVFAKKIMPKTQETGYKGTLPNIERYFEYKKDSQRYNPQNDIKGGTPNSGKLIKAPTDDDLFLDIIVKKEKYSPYVKDILDIMNLFEKLRISLIGENDIQKYNAQVNVIDLHVGNLVKNYGYGSYSVSDSYIWSQRIAYKAKLLGNLMYDANYYSRYMPVTDGQFSSRNIKKEKDNLVQELERAIFSLKQLE